MHKTPSDRCPSNLPYRVCTTFYARNSDCSCHPSPNASATSNPADSKSERTFVTDRSDEEMPILESLSPNRGLMFKRSMHTARMPVDTTASTSSCSLPSTVDIIGPMRPYTARPESTASLIALNLQDGRGAPGSVRLLTASSTLVTVTPIAWCISIRMSVSLRKRSDLVIMFTDMPVRDITSRHCLVSSKRFSAHWYGSVDVPIPITPLRGPISLDNLVAMFCLTPGTLHPFQSECVTSGA